MKRSNQKVTGLSIDSDFLSWPLRLNLKPIRMTRRSGVGKGLGEKSTDDGPLPTEKVTVEIISKTGSKPKAKGPHLDMDIKQEDEAGPSKLNSEFCINKLLTAVGGATVMPLVAKYAFLQMTVNILSHLHCLVQSLKHFSAVAV